MKYSMGFVASIAMSVLMGTSALASVLDLPVSKNYLVNYSINFLANNPQADDLSVFNEAFALEVRTDKNKEALFLSANEALRQISQETLQGAEAYRKTGAYGDYVRSQSGNDRFRFVTTIQDERLRNMSDPSFIYNGVVGVTLTQLHSLTEAQFAKFADSFIQTLKDTQVELARSNSLNQESFVRDEVVNSRSLLEEIPQERLQKALESVRASANRSFLEYRQATVTAAARLLVDLVSVSVARENMKNADAESLKIQRVRVLTLMARALSQTDAFSEAQRPDIVKAAKLFSSADIENIMDKNLKQAMKEAYLSKEVQELTMYVKDLGEGKIQACGKIF